MLADLRENGKSFAGAAVGCFEKQFNNSEISAETVQLAGLLKLWCRSRVSGFNYHNINWLDSKGSKCLKSVSVSSSCIVIFSNG